MLLNSRRMTSRQNATLFDATFERPARTAGDQGVEEDRPGLSRGQLIERIMDLNATASEPYLEDFSDASLSRYLAHLESKDSPRGGRWERPGDSPAILMRETDF